MHYPWIDLLKSLPLQKEEKEIFKRFEKEPEGRSFLASAEILKAHRKIDDAVELLSWGVNRHPQFTVARIVLVRELFAKGLIADASRVLEESPTDLGQNVLTIKLSFRISTLLKDYKKARDALLQLKTLNAIDPETKRFSDAFELQTPDIARELILAHLRNLGVEAVLPVAPSSDVTLLPEKIDIKPMTTSDIDDLLLKSFTLQSYDEEKLGGFHASRLSEIFAGKESQRPIEGGTIDSATLVDIYAGQGHYKKAATMLKRLIAASPSNDHLKAKLREVQRAETASTRVDEGEMFKNLETGHIIDSQIRFFEDLLRKLPT